MKLPWVLPFLWKRKWISASTVSLVGLFTPLFLYSWYFTMIRHLCILSKDWELTEVRDCVILTFGWLYSGPGSSCFIQVINDSVQSLSCVRLFATPWIAARKASLSITNSWSLLKLMSIESVMPSSHLILCSPLFLLGPIPPSIRVFSNESALRMRWPKYWSFSFSISPSNEHPRLLSFRMDWLDLLAVQGTFNGLLQHDSSKVSGLRCSAFFIVQLSHPYVCVSISAWQISLCTPIF